MFDFTFWKFIIALHYCTQYDGNNSIANDTRCADVSDIYILAKFWKFKLINFSLSCSIYDQDRI